MPENSQQSRARRRTRLAQRRKAVGLTQEQLAERLEIDPTTVARWERGETQPQPWLRPKLARILKVTPDRIEELLADPGSGSPDGTGTRQPELPRTAGPELPKPGAGSDGPGNSGRAAPVVPRQLPAEVPSFTGRDAELTALTKLLDEATGSSDTPGTVVISAIGGTAGIGKTALALHWAHRVAGRFGDGQLHVNLRGFDPSGTPLTPETAIRGFLDTLGVPPERVPAQPDAQAGLYRSLLADRKMLIVLDNARDEQQVRPLLPASPGSLVLVTSRSQLSGLAATDGAQFLTLDVLSHPEAVQLLTTRIGAARAAKEPEAVDAIALLCGHLPLALAVAAARTAIQPRFPLSTLAEELRDATGRLDALDAGDPATSIRAVFSWSYQQLSHSGSRMFRLLGLHPGPDCSVPVAASLVAATVPETRGMLRELAHAHLIDERSPGRYTFHDLLRAYAADQCCGVDSETDRYEAIGRSLDHYLHTADAATRVLDPGLEHITLAAPRTGTAPESVVSRQQALAWFGAEHRALLSAVTLADDNGFHAHAWQLPWTMAHFLAGRGYLQDFVATQRTAAAAAIRLDDADAQALCYRMLGAAYAEFGDYGQALRHFDNSQEIYQRLGNQLGGAQVHRLLGILAERQGRYGDALSHSEQALRLHQAAGDKVGAALPLNNVGWYQALLGNYQQARAHCQQALILSSETGNRRAEGYAWDSLGYAEHHLGNLGEAAACYERALGIAREFGDRLIEADTLRHLGHTHHAAVDLPRAREAWQQALEILDDLQHPDADEVRTKLDALDD